MPDRRDRAVVGGDLRRAAIPERARQAMASVDGSWCARTTASILLLTPPFDKMTPSPGYIQGYVPGVRENGGQYTHARAVERARLRAARRRRPRGGALRAAQSGQSRAHARGVERYRAEPYVVAADVYSQRPTPVEADGPGTPGRPAGCIASGWRESSASRSNAARSASIPASRARGHDMKLTYRSRNSQYHIVVENPDGVNRGVRQVEVDGRERADHVIPIVDDGQVHHVRVVLGTV